MQKGRKGFTLLELMIVVAIIGILAAIAIAQYAVYKDRGYVASMQSDIHTVRVAEEAYYGANHKFTTTLTDLSYYGFKDVSEANTVTVAPVTDITQNFKVTVTSTRTSKSVVYDSTTGQTTTH